MGYIFSPKGTVFIDIYYDFRRFSLIHYFILFSYTSDTGHINYNQLRLIRN